MRLGLPDSIQACLFDLDGVLTETAKVHAAAWKEMFDDFLRRWAEQHGEPFRPFAIRLNNGAQYAFVDRRDVGATKQFNMIFHFGERGATRIDSDRIVEIMENT